MEAGLSLRLIEPDIDYNGVELRAWNDRFCATTFLYLDFGRLLDFGSAIAGFPRSLSDDRAYVLGTRDPAVVGGYCALHFHSEAARHVIDLSIDDSASRFSSGKAEFRIPVEASWIDHFVEALEALEHSRVGEARLGPSL